MTLLTELLQEYAKAVSYTHLDVYKRQDCIRTQVPGGNKIFHDELIDQHGEISRLHKAS